MPCSDLVGAGVEEVDMQYHRVQKINQTRIVCGVVAGIGSAGGSACVPLVVGRTQATAMLYTWAGRFQQERRLHAGGGRSCGSRTEAEERRGCEGPRDVHTRLAQHHQQSERPGVFLWGTTRNAGRTTGVARKTGPGPNICVLVQFSISYTRSLYNSTFSCGLWTFANLALRELASTSHFLSPIGSSSLSSEAPAADGTAARPPAGRA